MKPKTILLGLTTLTVAAIAVLFLFATPQSSVKTFRVRGEIRGIALAEKTIRIAHEEIPGYMPAMTMPLNIKSPSLFQGLSLGDHIRFELTVTDKSSWISAIEKLPMPTSLEAPAEPPIASGMDREADRVKTGQAVPDFALLNQNGDRIQLSDYRGKYVLVTFIYTRCPIPDFCPLMSKKFQSLQDRLQKSLAGQYQLLSISIDPAFDQPPILRDYAARYDADVRTWSFCTGTQDQVNFVAGLFGLFHEPENGLISHDLRTALIGPDGRLIHLWKSNVWTPYEVQRKIEQAS